MSLFLSLSFAASCSNKDEIFDEETNDILGVYHFCPNDKHPHKIDLGLPSGTKWACCNIDATAPEEFGGYYAWGETETKNVYSKDTYKYFNYENGCIHIADDIAGTKYDVAYVKWGDSWRMPSDKYIIELINNCTYIWTRRNGVYGLLVTGSNGATIFLPAAVKDWHDDLGYETMLGLYWMSTLYSSSYNPGDETYAYNLIFHSENCYVTFYGRQCGFPVRAVCP